MNRWIKSDENKISKCLKDANVTNKDTLREQALKKLKEFILK